MDDSLTKNALNLAKWAPTFLLFNGYWMLSNRQIFADHWTFLDKQTEGMRSEHLVKYFSVDWATPVEIMAFASLVLTVVQVLFADQLQHWGFTMQSKEITVDEDLPNFYKAIRLQQADETVLEN
mmetsp:Transcript_16102/g.25007  ORF Transcript_16102/g.25007 Transcript_16102/m.25007 type:complete len:124 (-) Transcript_16102:564-935(-)